MKAKKIILLSITLVLVLSLALAFVACKNKPDGDNPPVDNPPVDNPPVDETKLDTSIAVPQNISVSAVGKITWSGVSKADSYELFINGVVVLRTYRNYDIFSLEQLPADGKFSICVRAIKGEKYGNWSEKITYTYKAVALLYPTFEGLDGTVISWGENNKAEHTELVIGDTKNELDNTTTSYDLAALDKDTKISLTFKGDGVYVSDSPTASVIYHPSTKTLSLPSPENVRMEGTTLYYDSVLGANIYYFEDVNNTVTTCTDYFSDRTNRFLIRKIWAGNTDTGIGNSLPSDVTYFTDKNGLGTKDNPYIISNDYELRFVEYYESINQAKYYKLGADIVFGEYSPKPDEDISNFYNLGSLSGVIDGDGHSLTNTVVYYKDGYSSIFDSITATGVIKNLVITNANWRTWTNRTNDGIMHEKGGECAILAYKNRGTISNVSIVNSKVCAAKDGAAGLVSINYGTITGCSIDIDTTIYGANEAGGFAIYNSGTIERCVNLGQIGGLTIVGGMAGRNCGVISECANKGVVTANTYAGGIVGYNFNIFDETLTFKSLVEKCYNQGIINATAYGGGIVGKNGGDGINEVGTMSYANAGVYGCYNVGSINGSESLGGIVGDNYAFYDGEQNQGYGVRGCFNAGSILVDNEKLKSVRVFLSFENNSWAANDSPAFYVHYWGETASSSWPGIRMKEITSGGKQYLYADLGLQAADVDGLIFNRVNPNNKAEIYNQSDDIKMDFSDGNLLFKIDSEWKTASVSSSENVLENSQLNVGAIVGFSNMINDCYYVMGTQVNDSAISAGVAGGTQFNKIMVNGTEHPDSAIAIDENSFANLANTLNAVLGEYYVNGTRHPVLCWQNQE